MMQDPPREALGLTEGPTINISRVPYPPPGYRLAWVGTAMRGKHVLVKIGEAPPKLKRVRKSKETKGTYVFRHGRRFHLAHPSEWTIIEGTNNARENAGGK